MIPRAIVSGVSWSTVSALAARGSLIGVSIILSRGLTTEDFTKYSYIYYTVMMLVTYSSFGLGVTASKLFAEGKSRDLQQTNVGVSLWILSSLIVLILSFLVLLTPTEVLSGRLEIPNWIFALGLFIFGIGIVPTGALLGLELYRLEAFQAIITSAIYFLLASISVYIGEVDIAIGGLLLGGAVNSILKSRLVGNNIEVGLNLRKAVRFSVVFQAIKEAGPLIFVSLFSATGIWMIGRMLLNEVDGEELYKVYSIGLQWFALGLFVPSMISRVMLPRFIGAKYYQETYKREIIFSALGASGVTAGMFLIILFIGPFVSALYAIETDEYGWVFGGFAFAAFCCSPSNILGNALVANNFKLDWMVLSIISFLIMFGCFYFSERNLLNAVTSIAASFLSLTLMALISLKLRKIL